MLICFTSLTGSLVMCYAFSAAAQPVADKPTSPEPLIISVGSTARLQMKSKRPMTRVEVDREGIIRIRPAPNDQTTLMITGLAPGYALITLFDDGGKSETHEWGKPPK